MEREEHFDLLSMFNDMEMALTTTQLFPLRDRKCLENTGIQSAWKIMQNQRQKFLKEYQEKFGISYYKDVENRIKADPQWAINHKRKLEIFEN